MRGSNLHRSQKAIAEEKIRTVLFSIRTLKRGKENRDKN